MWKPQLPLRVLVVDELAKIRSKLPSLLSDGSYLPSAKKDTLPLDPRHCRSILPDIRATGTLIFSSNLIAITVEVVDLVYYGYFAWHVVTFQLSMGGAYQGAISLAQRLVFLVYRK